MKSSLLVLTCVVIFSIIGFGQSNGLTQDLSHKFKKFTLNRLDSKDELDKVRAGKSITIKADEKKLVLSLIVNDLRAANYKQIAKTPTGDIEFPRSLGGLTTFKGYVEGENSSMVRLTLNGTKIEGLISIGNNSYYIEPAKNYSSSADAQDFVVYKDEDLLNRNEMPHSLVSKVKEGIRTTNEKFVNISYGGSPLKSLFRNNFVSSPTMDGTTYKVIRLLTDADVEYIADTPNQLPSYYPFQRRLQQTNDYINENLNIVQGVYERDALITFSIIAQTGHTADPFGGSDVLGSFRGYWETSYPASGISLNRDLTILFSGQAAGGNSAYPGTICNAPDFAYAIINGDYSFASYYEGWYRRGALAHEIGHILGGSHVDDHPEWINANPDCYNSILGPLDPVTPQYPIKICGFSVNQFQQHLATYNCLSTVTR